MSSTTRIVLIIVGAALALFVGGGVLMYRACSTIVEKGAESGVKLASDLSPSAAKRIAPLLGADEKPVAYYDATISNDGSEFFLLTNRRVVHSTNGVVRQIPLDRVESVDHTDGGIQGDIIMVRSKDSDYLQITIAPLNDGPVFLDALRSEWRRATGAPAGP